MSLVKEKYERVVVDEIDEARCDQCGKQLPITDYQGMLEYPDGWLLVRKVRASIKPLERDSYGADSFCSWTCLSTYAASKSQGRIAVPV